MCWTRAAGIQYCRECWREILIDDCKQYDMYFMIEHALEYKVIGGGCSLKIAGFDRA